MRWPLRLRPLRSAPHRGSESPLLSHLSGPCLLIDNFLILLVLPEAPGLHVLLHFAQPVQAAQEHDCRPLLPSPELMHLCFDTKDSLKEKGEGCVCCLLPAIKIFTFDKSMFFWEALEGREMVFYENVEV
ncbi:uncharacterized protein LOC120654855 isoform X2 [Panicum virgatum]|uniref:Uncharacterized protein n=1 Tax=Panicum virgatum TaxID=38727 RepID=A0A8T0WJ63_PANVG|nr:uncharacterized protein LOC120654855 isoform X2 [Panicum virgatum]KAG2648982.1 hypothetical protein PVAP13_1NG107466 [Panicum virgatum]